VRASGGAKLGGSWASAATLFVYAIPFSLAYLKLPAGSGALLLFGMVQATMIGWGLFRGEHPKPGEWLGLLLSLGGLVALVLPSVSAPPPASAALMAIAGASWAAYSLQGRGIVDPLAANAGNFLRVAPAVVAVAAAVAFAGGAHLSTRGLLLATASGALCSGVGYAIWYFALRGLTRTRAAIVQLAVPVIAAVGGAAVLGETFTLRLLASGAVIFAGVALALLSGR
jgi:drug/metabolite transporter (DMT)-like permease